MRHLEKPPEVKAAQRIGDHDALSRMGRIGGEHAALNRALRQESQKQRLQELIREQAELYTVTPEGDVLPPDPIITALEK